MVAPIKGSARAKPARKNSDVTSIKGTTSVNLVVVHLRRGVFTAGPAQQKQTEELARGTLRERPLAYASSVVVTLIELASCVGNAQGA